MAEQGHYPEYWEADVVLRDGGTGHLRPVTPADAPALQEFHMKQSQSSIYLRFFTYKAKLSNKELARFTNVDYRDRVAFVITIGAEIIGIGRYDRLDDPTEAEVAFNISDGHQGRGLGSILLEHLAAAARENGIRRFSAEVLPENRKMIGVFADAGYEVRRHFDDGVIALDFNIDPTDKSRAVMEAREHRAEARSVADLLSPSSVAVIGASREWGTVGYQLLEHIIEGGFTGSVYAVNPEAFELAGMVCHARIADVPEPVQLAIIAVPYDQVLGVAEECARAGVKELLVATAGFANDGERGLARQRRLVRHARANGMRVVGPASLGLINTRPDVSLNASMAPAMPARGGLGLFSQSAGIGVLLYAAAQRRGLGLSSTISAGNRADVSGNDAMQYWEDDTDTRVVGMYLESVGNPRKFSRIARRLATSKPVIVAKSDVTGLQLPPGHAVRTTQAPAGALDAMLRQSGVIRVNTNEQLMDVVQIAVSQPLPAGRSLAVFSNSAALGRVVADAALGLDLELGSLQTDLVLDAGMSVALPLLRATVTKTLADDAVHAAVVTLLPSPGLTTEKIAQCLQECAAETGKPVVAAFTGIMDPGAHVEGILTSGSSGSSGSTGEDGRQPGLPCFSSPGAAVAALASLVRYTEWSARDHGHFIEPAGADPDGARAFIDTLLTRVAGDGLTRLTADETTRLLRFYGVELLPSLPFTSGEEAVAAADTLGWPVVIKTMDEHLRHRLDLGGVRLNISTPEDLLTNIAQMKQALEPYGSFELEVQSMAPSGQGCMVRAIEDPLLGPVLSFGLAGDAVNLLDDWAHGIPPLTDTDVADLVRAPRASGKLFGYQGLPKAHVAALEDLISRLALLKDEHPEIALLEINPVLVSTTGVTVLSADVRLGNPQQRTDSARRAMRD
ncbi:GNAT family N-acetyltransferase [Arthrobacter sp. zg-Y820]|uniref:bifunctional acetate--CoA ligase family protein/GNAT family N-acetyltransferase n=1 Tax=unclassified Arthrobacter TaxID=235627 RepID=UPI001E3A1C48|nr:MULTISPECIES: bifunctional GNAT family N-acetyltransferase/acetate--CoA ligase family protein [unclassified Arthrobacter]MCC9197801.1 GNAT family N-acetyltransferase [Arthrobacter sp. zg-Y820]MDK1280668.1 GNAT family N-acetyltransferase [Arthrobacter sp. zg.Y820]WIB10699.1 GNAT family N-acetyltransferase [Arthrobacter sp. zg-Y820]